MNKGKVIFLSSSFTAAIINYILIIILSQNDHVLKIWNTHMSLGNIILSVIGGFTIYYVNKIAKNYQGDEKKALNIRDNWYTLMKMRFPICLIGSLILSLILGLSFNLSILSIIFLNIFILAEVFLLFNQGYFVGAKKYSLASLILVLYSILKLALVYILMKITVPENFYFVGFGLSAALIFIISTLLIKEQKVKNIFKEGEFKFPEFNKSHIVSSIIALLTTNFIINVAYLIAQQFVGDGEMLKFAPFFNLGQILIFLSTLLMPVYFNEISEEPTVKNVVKNMLLISVFFIFSLATYSILNFLNLIPSFASKFIVNLDKFLPFSVFIYFVTIINYLIQCLIAINHFKSIKRVFFLMLSTTLALFLAFSFRGVGVVQFINVFTILSFINLIYISYEIHRFFKK